MREALLTVTAYYITMNLFKPACNPDCVYAQVIEVAVFNLLSDTLEVTTLERSYIIDGSNRTVTVKTAVVAVVV
ncbi:MAG: hypothetical protein IJ298_10305 [Ruminococcus sp.]|nr:hypothetical protein [Ruminococcus sp.]